MMATQIGISVEFGSAHLARTWGSSRTGCARFKLSNDPKFVEKLRDVVGLYVDPPAHAIVHQLLR